MRKLKGISLIETLISLTIVGTALIALLPVVTVKQTAFSVSSGNEYFSRVPANTQAGTDEYFTPVNPNARVLIGDFDNNLQNNNENLIVNTDNFAYRNIPVLNATQRLYYNNNQIQVINDGLNISSGSRNEITMQYPLNVFLNNHNIIINNSTAANFPNALDFTPRQHANDTWTLNKYYTNPADSVNTLPLPVGAAAQIPFEPILTDGNSNFYLITHNNNEYFNYNSNVINGARARQIGIGQNAIRDYYPLRNFIGIFNNNNPLAYNMGASRISLAIGRSTANNIWQNEDSFIISHIDENTAGINDDYIYLNANVTTGANNWSTTNVILTSDKRLKTILGDYKKSLKEILKIKPVIFTYKNDEQQKNHVGVIAQDIRKTFPEAVKTGNDNYLLVSVEPMFYALLNSIKELNNKNMTLKQQNDELEKKIKQLRKIAGGENE